MLQSRSQVQRDQPEVSATQTLGYTISRSVVHKDWSLQDPESILYDLGVGRGRRNSKMCGSEWEKENTAHSK